jgi:hypothetical protein
MHPSTRQKCPKFLTEWILKYDHECRKTYQIKHVCGTCYAHEFNLNAFRHEWSYIQYHPHVGGHRGRDSMVVGFTITCAISAYHHWRCEFESRSGKMYSIQNHRSATSHWQTYHIMLYRVHLAWAGFKLTTSVVIGTYCTSNCKSNYHTITTTMTPDMWMPNPQHYASLLYWYNFCSIRIIKTKSNLIFLKKGSTYFIRSVYKVLTTMIKQQLMNR